MIKQKRTLLEQAFSVRFASVLLAVGAAATFYCPAAAQAQSTTKYGLYNTGISPAGMIGMEGLDSEYTVAYEAGTGSTPDPGTPLTSPSTYVTDLSNLPQYQPADDGTSAFISPYPTYSSGQSNLGGIYDFTTTFDLSSVSDLSSVALSGRFESDDRIQDILINGHSLGIFLTDPDYTAFSAYYNLAPVVSDLNAGLNTITVQVYNYTTGSNTDPVALRAEFVAAVPEPSVWASVGALASLLLFGSWLRRRRVAV